MSDFLIYGSPVSPFARKVAAVCIEKGVPFEIEALNIMDPPDWFEVISPLKRIPILRDQSVGTEGAEGTIADSSAICGYIEKKHPTPALYPDAAFDYGRALWLEEYGDSALITETGGAIFRPVFFSIMKGEAPDIETASTAWKENLPRLLGYLNDALGNRDFFVGNRLSIADIAIVTSLMQAELVAEVPLEDWPALAAHHKRMNERASVAGPYAQAASFVSQMVPEKVNLA